MSDNFGRVVGGALHKLEQDKRRLEQEVADLKAKLEEETTWRIAACQAHSILSRGIKHALKLKHWPDFHKLYGDGLFSTGVVRLLQEKMVEKDKLIKGLKRESAKVREPKRTRMVSGCQHTRKRSGSAKVSVSASKA